MRKSASWAPAPNLKVLAVERNETDWIVVRDRGSMPRRRLPRAQTSLGFAQPWPPMPPAHAPVCAADIMSSASPFCFRPFAEVRLSILDDGSWRIPAFRLFELKGRIHPSEPGQQRSMTGRKRGHWGCPGFAKRLRFPTPSRSREVFEVANNGVSRRHSVIACELSGLLLQVLDQMGERRLVEIMQHVSQFLIARPPRSEPGSVGLAQRGYERIAVLLADFAVLVSVTAVEAGFLRHDGFLCLMRERLPHHLGL